MISILRSVYFSLTWYSLTWYSFQIIWYYFFITAPQQGWILTPEGRRKEKQKSSCLSHCIWKLSVQSILLAFNSSIHHLYCWNNILFVTSKIMFMTSKCFHLKFDILLVIRKCNTYICRCEKLYCNVLNVGHWT